MRQVLTTLSFCLLIVWAQAQDASGGIVFKKTWMDFLSANAGNFGDFKNYNSGFEVGYQHALNNNLHLFFPLRLGVVKVVEEVDLKNRIISGLDGQLQYRFQPSKPVVPYLLAGVGSIIENLDQVTLQAPAGIGFDFRIKGNSFINLQAEYRFALEENKNNIQFGFGWKYFFGTPSASVKTDKKVMDSDGDGIPDDIDLCPQQAGLKALSGCPDSDGDGVEDARDECPKVAGLKVLNGCPDSDGDGISDKDDECPNLAGLIANRGCPGSDGDNDGIIDDQDECPNEPGSVTAKGCPDRDGDGVPDKTDACPDKKGNKPNGCPDSDGDGVDDSKDKCPDTPGPAANKGCPELSQAEKEILRLAMRDVQFEHNKAIIRPESYRVLNQIADLLRKYSAFKLVISGYTDNTGSLMINQTLSEKRAKACFDYLVDKSIASSRMRYAGYGPRNPIANNNTQTGRALNRRVEFEMIIE